MKPLMSEKITRARQYVGDWVPASAHDGAQGLADFGARMQARIEAARKAIQKQDKVRLLRK